MKPLEREHTFLQKLVIYKNLPLKHFITISHRPGTEVILFSEWLTDWTTGESRFSSWRGKYFSLLHTVHTGSGVHPLPI
jgi:hypothetical protein